MKRLLPTKRAAIVAVGGLVMGAVAVLFGTGVASADYPCGDNSPPQDTTVELNDQYFVGVDVQDPTILFGKDLWICAETDTGSTTPDYAVVSFRDPSPQGTGLTVSAGSCGLVPAAARLGNDPHWSGCGAYVVEPTGANAGSPTVTPNTPFAGTPGSGATVTSPGTCVYANSTTPTCPAEGTLLWVAVNEADLVPVVTLVDPQPPCTLGINNECVPLGATVEIFDDGLHHAINVTTPATGVQHIDPGRQCIQVNATC